jgi:uncharacterized glyoxalase superfamily protein PhnB
VIARLYYLNILSPDIDRLMYFYASVFAFEEVPAHRSPIHCALDAGGCLIGFNADPAYDLLRLERPDGAGGDRAFATFEARDRETVDGLTAAALEHGATLVKSAADTGYGWYQAVLRDPDGNPFRINFSGAGDGA